MKKKSIPRLKHKILLFLFLSIQILSFSQVNLTNRLVGYFPFNGNANDESPISINGIVNNALLTSDNNGNSNSAYSFNGINSFIDCNTDNRNIIDTIVISAWINTFSSDYQWIVGKYDWVNDKGYHMAMIGGQVFVGGRNTGGQYIEAKSPSFHNDGNWHHVMAVIYSNTWEIWVDCQLEATSYSNATNPNLTNSVPLSIGHYSVGDVNGGPLFFNGRIDQVRLYNRLLATDEINVLCSGNITSSNDIILETNNVQVFPNPTNGIFFLEMKDDFKYVDVSISDIQGKEVFRKRYLNAHELIQLNLNKEAGIYLVTVKTPNNLSFFRMVKTGN